MKTLKLMSLLTLSAALVCGCGGKKAQQFDKPKVADGTVVAIGAAMPEKGMLKQFVEDTYNKLHQDNSMKQVLDISKKAGLDSLDGKWALLTSSMPKMVNGVPEKVPNVALAIYKPHDLDKIVSVLTEESKGEFKAEKTEIVGKPAYKVSIDDGEASQLGVEPYVASLDGKLVIITSNRAAMEAEIKLYCEGVGASKAFGGFTLGNGDIIRVAVTDVGKHVVDAVGMEMLACLCEVFPDGDKVAAGIGMVSVAISSADGNSLSAQLTAETAADEHAKSLAEAATGVLFVVNAQIADAAKRGDENAKVVKSLLNEVKFVNEGKTFKASAVIPEPILREALDNAKRELDNELKYL